MFISLVAGFLLSNQSPINADLSRLVKPPFNSDLAVWLVAVDQAEYGVGSGAENRHDVA
ncbi:hypothetical protein HMPREF9103_01994 [Lentilactobacillus parafarraginis F0439]|uniref:Uncharacterized protein n=1 Tax=Lentilactobacillus parafarraginis F0439 TaxID=797515 RepID=G9ZQI7_9LACO|nr:hypothetical protein [Lentilactobacillus parafarraginis]EHL97435.1 hypothetical protein HMPREF9103_01994 [Lentilactobacillus parafarraginis F0439]